MLVIYYTNLNLVFYQSRTFEEHKPDGKSHILCNIFFHFFVIYVVHLIKKVKLG